MAKTKTLQPGFAADTECTVQGDRGTSTLDPIPDGERVRVFEDYGQAYVTVRRYGGTGALRDVLRSSLVPVPTKAANTDELFAYFEHRRKQALREQSEWLREIAIKSAIDSEWHTLFSALNVPAMRTLYDTARIAERLGQLRTEIGAR